MHTSSDIYTCEYFDIGSFHSKRLTFKCFCIINKLYLFPLQKKDAQTYVYLQHIEYRLLVLIWLIHYSGTDRSSLHWNATGLSSVHWNTTGWPIEYLQGTREHHWKISIETAPHWNVTGETYFCSLHLNITGGTVTAHTPRHIWLSIIAFMPVTNDKMMLH